MKSIDIKGIILIAPEGINLSISVLASESDFLIRNIKEIFNLEDQDFKISFTNKHIYRKLKVKIKKEILTTRMTNDIKPQFCFGDYIKPKDWNTFITDPNVLLIDARNYYETNIGTFKNAVDPKARNFTEILQWLDKSLLRNSSSKKKIAMFCTGGIRCEKASSYLKSKGKNEVYQLEGGILKYFEYSMNKSKWNGECFVFDNRVTIDSDLKRGSYVLCFACRMPLSKKDVHNKKYVKGISCHYCHGEKTIKQIKKYKERNQQTEK